MKESAYLIKAKQLVRQVVFPTKVQGPLYSVLHNLEIGMRRTYQAPLKDHIEWHPEEGFHCTLSFELWLPDPDSENRSFLRWTIERGASGHTIEELIDNVREVMRRVEDNKRNIEKGLALLHVQNMKRIEAEELARGLEKAE